jgi:ArsR family transcriptional regulator, arsenate/arsenite/antimonite-responsive transcriptional repressor
MLTALAQETRLTVFRSLAAAGAEKSAGTIADELRVPAPTLSFHLKELAHAGLIVARRDGRNVWYSLDERNVSRLMAFLLQDCCGGNPVLCGVDLCVTGDCVPAIKTSRRKGHRP